MPFSFRNLSCSPPLVLALVLFLSTITALSQTMYEAESAALSNDAQIENCPTCSGGKEVGSIGGNNDGAVTFRVNAHQAGLYALTVFYNVHDDRSLRVTINTNTVLDLIFQRNSPDSDHDSSRTLFVPLDRGENTVRFDNSRENGPDLDDIVADSSPTPSAGVSGVVDNAKGMPAANLPILLSGFGLKMRTVTDARGRYQFPFLARRNYYIRPLTDGLSLFPFEWYCALTNSAQLRLNFSVRRWPHRRLIKNLQCGDWRIEYDLTRGTANIFHRGTALISDAFAVARLPQTVTSMDYKSRKILQQPVHDAFGNGIKFIVESSNGKKDRMFQTFWLYDNADFFLADVAVFRKGGVRSNYLSPLTTRTPCSFLPNGGNRALFVPFDNDKWDRYDSFPFGKTLTSYEVSAFYNNASRNGLIIGSIEHESWKTGITSVTDSNGLAALDAFGGIASTATRDVLPHGKISGTTVKSPKIFVGWYLDWRNGLEDYARANATVAPRREWTGGPPFGWNSWGKLQFRVSYAKAIQVSDFFARQLPDFKDNGVVYIGLDAGWTKFTQDQLKRFVAHCRANGQEAGIYFTPFTDWGENDNSDVPGTAYKFKDLFLYANGRKESIDGGVALDPTHPGTHKLIADTIARFKAAGFTYVKADFLTQGALEADHFYDSHVTTGIQAYNEGMKFVDEQLGKNIFLNESIAPLFPAQYADSRRIACDAFGAISQVEYTLNSLTYGWWLSKTYDFNDPDEIVLDGYTQNENRARVTSAAITGNFISGDDFSDDGSTSGKQRAEIFLANNAINNLARELKDFRPVEGDTGDRAANVFSFQDGKDCYVAAFNYSWAPTNWTANLGRIGFHGTGECRVTSLWTGSQAITTNLLHINLGPADAAVYRLENCTPINTR